MAEELDELTGGLRRTWATVRLTGKLGMKTAGRMFRKKPDGETVLDDAEVADAIKQARALVDKMSSLKGLVMKAGQIASYMPGSIPPAAQRVFAELQAQSTPMTYARIDEVLRAELGASGGELFDSIDPVPFASASIGQVHRAVHRGVPVAVKVQYPGIEDAMKSDLKTVGVIARMSTIGSPIDGKAVTAELRDRLLEECDYTREAKNQALFAEILATIPGARVPTVIAERSSRRVLTTTLVEDARLADMSKDQAARDRAGQIIYRACFQLLFVHCIYNADPHPGNYLVADDGSVTFLDFGCVRRFDPQMIRTWKQLARAVLDNDKVTFATKFRALGFVGKEKGFDWDYQFAAMRTLYRPFLEPGYRYQPDDVMKSFGILMFDNPNRFRIAMPPEWLFLNRLQWGLNAVLAQLGATGPWGPIIDELLSSDLEPA